MERRTARGVRWKQKGKAGVAFPFFAASLRNGRKKLEAEANAYFGGTRSVDLATEGAPCGCRSEVEERVGELVVVENVGEYGLEFGAEAFVDVDVFLDLEINVPERHAAKYASAALARSRPKIGLRTQANTAAGFAKRLAPEPAVPMPLEPATLLWRELPKLLAHVRTPFSSAAKPLASASPKA